MSSRARAGVGGARIVLHHLYQPLANLFRIALLPGGDGPRPQAGGFRGDAGGFPGDGEGLDEVLQRQFLEDGREFRGGHGQRANGRGRERGEREAKDEDEATRDGGGGHWRLPQV